MRRYFRDRVWTVKPPRDLQELYLDVHKAREQLYQDLRREPTARDVALQLGRSVDDVVDALQAADAYRARSLNAPLDVDDDHPATAQDLLVDDRDAHGHCENAVTVEQLGVALSERDREVVRMRFREDMLQHEIADRVGCSQMHVSRILRTAVIRMQQTAAGQPSTSDLPA